MGIVIKKPTPIEVPKDLKCTTAQDRKEVAAIDDAQEAAAFNIDGGHYMELSAKPFLELEEKLKSKGFGSDKVSTFFLTVSINLQDLISKAQMREVAERFFNQIENHFRFLNCKHPETNNISYVDSIDIETAVEKGKKQEQVHLHRFIKFKHRTKLQFDL